MARGVVNNSPAFGSDSFTDVVTNVVGILIVLVIVVGVRVRNAPVSDLTPAPDRELAVLATRSAALEGQTSRAVALAARLGWDATLMRDETGRLAALVTERDGDVATRRQELAARADEQLSLERQLAEAQAYLKRLEAEVDAAEAAAPQAERVESLPTPISKIVDGQEAHFQLRGGRIAYIPLDELLKELRDDVVQQVWKLRDLREATDMIGPIGGFRLRYTMERFDAAPFGPRDAAGGARPRGSYAELTRWTLVPIDAQMGETLAEALAEGSRFRRAVARLDPKLTTVTLWTYGDSFAEFRALKKELYQLGFATAARPLPDGHPIGGSPDGSKSAAE